MASASAMSQYQYQHQHKNKCNTSAGAGYHVSTGPSGSWSWAIFIFLMLVRDARCEIELLGKGGGAGIWAITPGACYYYGYYCGFYHHYHYDDGACPGNRRFAYRLRRRRHMANESSSVSRAVPSVVLSKLATFPGETRDPRPRGGRGGVVPTRQLCAAGGGSSLPVASGSWDSGNKKLSSSFCLGVHDMLDVAL